MIALLCTENGLPFHSIFAIRLDEKWYISISDHKGNATIYV